MSKKNMLRMQNKFSVYTPEMIGFFSKITGVEYPWNKYDQIVGSRLCKWCDGKHNGGNSWRKMPIKNQDN